MNSSRRFPSRRRASAIRSGAPWRRPPVRLAGLPGARRYSAETPRADASATSSSIVMLNRTPDSILAIMLRVSVGAVSLHSSASWLAEMPCCRRSPRTRCATAATSGDWPGGRAGHTCSMAEQSSCRIAPGGISLLRAAGSRARYSLAWNAGHVAYTWRRPRGRGINRRPAATRPRYWPDAVDPGKTWLEVSWIEPGPALLTAKEELLQLMMQHPRRSAIPVPAGQGFELGGCGGLVPRLAQAGPAALTRGHRTRPGGQPSPDGNRAGSPSPHQTASCFRPSPDSRHRLPARSTSGGRRRARE